MGTSRRQKGDWNETYQYGGICEWRIFVTDQPGAEGYSCRRQNNRNRIRMNSREKGAAGERELAGILKGYGYQCRRGQQFCGANGDADVVGLKDIHIECKRVEKLNLDAAMEQAIRDARAGEIPAVFHRRNRKEWKVTLRLDDFMKLYTAAQEENGKAGAGYGEWSAEQERSGLLSEDD